MGQGQGSGLGPVLVGGREKSLNAEYHHEGQVHDLRVQEGAGQEKVIRVRVRVRVRVRRLGLGS